MHTTTQHTIGPAPLTPGSITDANVYAIANLLHRMQARYTADYLLHVAANGYTDSDYDYLGGALDASQALLALSYEGSANDLHTWLFGSPDDVTTLYGVPLAGLAGDCLCPLLAQAYLAHWH